MCGSAPPASHSIDDKDSSRVNYDGGRRDLFISNSLVLGHGCCPTSHPNIFIVPQSMINLELP